MNRFTLPRDLYFGRGALTQLANIQGQKAIIILGGGSMRKFGFVDKATSYLTQAGLTYQFIENIEPDPSIETIMKGAKQMREFEPDWIIAIGGGSCMDAAKAMWIFYEHPQLEFDAIVAPFSLPQMRTKARFIGIPSTSGTASEVTAFSVVTNYSNKIKYPLADYEITPDIAILDPDLTDSLPLKLVAYTGMDALTHAIEAYVSTGASLFTDPLALKAIRTIVDRLPASYQCDAGAREDMHYAQCLAGMSFTNAMLGIVHSLAHKTGAMFNIPHGCANAIYLPYVIQFNQKACLHKYAEIATCIGLQGHSDAELIHALCQKIRNMNRAMNIPLSLKEYRIKEDDFYTNVSLISARSLDDACTASNPRTINLSQMEQLLICIYEGISVTF